MTCPKLPGYRETAEIKVIPVVYRGKVRSIIVA
jgi:hypothetical protein